MKCSPRFRRNKRYIKNSNKLSFFIFYAVFLAPCGATEKHGYVPPQRRFSKRCFQNDSMFLIFRPECFQNESRFSRFANQTQRMIMPRSESFRGALQERARDFSVCSGASHSYQNGTVSFFGSVSFPNAWISLIARFAKGWLLIKSPSASFAISVSFFKKSKRISPHSPS